MKAASSRALVICLALGSVTFLAVLYIMFVLSAEPQMGKTKLNAKEPAPDTLSQTSLGRIIGSPDGARPLPPEEKHAIEEAQKFFAANIGRLQEILGDEYFRALAKRDAEAPLLEAVVRFGEEYRTRFREEHADMEARALGISTDTRKKGREIRPALSLVREVTFYDRVLRSTDAVEELTLGGIARDLLANTEQFAALKAKLLKAERGIMHDEQMAARLETIDSGEQLTSLIAEVAPRYAAEEKRLLAQVPLDEDLQHYLSGLDYADRVWGLTQLYKRSWSNEVDALSEEYQSLMLQMKALLAKVPSDRPEKSALAQQLHDLVAMMHQQENKRRLEKGKL